MKGNQVAVSMMGPTIGRQINEGEIFYSLPSDAEIKTINAKYLSSLSEEDSSLLSEIVRTRRKTTPLYGY
ncbi:MAG: hypothetical protein M1368_11235 [Thaumarchaeota archaeon]|nr:hypothetical protein [Nitrososphaerota archaeon]